VCLAYPGKIKKIKGDKAMVDFSGIVKEVNISLAKVKAGDYVIVHAGFAIQKMTKEDAWAAIDLFAKN